MDKDDGAFLTIGELARELGVAQHILRYWETRFPQLKPLQRSGSRRYYRPRDVETARTINRLLNEDGFTVRGAQRALAGRKAAPVTSDASVAAAAVPATHASATSNGREQHELVIDAPPPGAAAVSSSDLALLIARLTVIRQNLQDALEPDE